MVLLERSAWRFLNGGSALQTFDLSELARFASAVYEAMGVAPSSAFTVADSLAQADAWGHPSHGVMRTFWYAKRIASGATRLDRSPEVVVDASALAVVDGHNGIGQVVAQTAMHEAVDRAKRFGVGAVAVRHSGHFGTAMYFTRQAAQQGCVALMSTNASPAMAPWGGMEKRVGTNPWSVAAPAGRYPPMLLDIANTAVARGKLYVAQQRGEPIPLGWAMDAGGQPTTDAAEGIAGTILPMAGHKGYAIATVMDVLSGVLSGSRFGEDVVGPYVPDGDSGVGHLVVAIDIAACRPLAEFHADMERYIERLKSTPTAPGFETVCYPGELEAEAEARHRIEGIVLPEVTVRELNEGASALGVPALVPRA
ncbi:MAG: Ldh family oxidoreductase [Pseudomonadota bacterium]